MEKAIEKTVKPSIVDKFLKGCGKGFKVGIENVTPAMILGYTLVYILQVTGLMTFLGRIFAPVMGVFGLPGEAFAVLISAFFAKASGCATAATMYADGVLTLGLPVSSWERSLGTTQESFWWREQTKNGIHCY